MKDFHAPEFTGGRITVVELQQRASAKRKQRKCVRETIYRLVTVRNKKKIFMALRGQSGCILGKLRYIVREGNESGQKRWYTHNRMVSEAPCACALSGICLLIIYSISNFQQPSNPIPSCFPKFSIPPNFYTLKTFKKSSKNSPKNY